MKAEDNQFPYVTLKESAAAPATPGAGLVRAYVDADDGRLYLVDDAGTAHPVAFTSDVGAGGGSAGGGGILGSASYYPATTATYSPPTALADVDATNAAVTFTAPASGVVIVRASFGYISDNAQAGIHVSLREGTTELADTRNRLAYGVAGVQSSVAMSWRISGLTPDSEHTYKLAYLAYGVFAGQCRIKAGGSTEWWGPLVMTVEAA